MKKIFITFFLILSFTSCAYAIEEIPLQLDDTPVELDVIKEEKEDVSDVPVDEAEYHKSLKDKIHDVFDLKVSDNEHIEYLFNNLLTKEFEKGPLSNIGLWGLWRGGLVESFENHDNHTNVSYNIVESRIHGQFRNKKTSFVITGRFTPQKEFTFMQNLFSDVFIRHRFCDKAVLTIGNTRTHTGAEGAQSELLIPFYFRSQISRQFGNIRKMGVRLAGDFSLMDYDIAVNTSGTYFTSFFPGAEFCGWVNFKPLGKTDGKYGKLIIGGGLTSGRRHFDYTDIGAYISYRYKKFKADFEVGDGNGYNGRMGAANIHARGYYTTLYYDLTNKVQLLARFDDFTPNTKDSSHHTREYSTGINYFIKGQTIKLMLNYVFREDSIAGNSHRIIIGTQIVL
ncbi:MAG: hypothetical protein K6E29_05160 [Cyanobacteria bacterium RUI128]|nr:hypothetical protein [Cyanobacteria bacterium RUI128]